MRGSCRALLVGVLIAGGWTTASAQVLRVEVRDSTSSAPIVRALVSVADDGGAEVTYGLTSDAGVVTLRLPRAGTWAVAVRRIGIAPRRVPGVVVAAGQTVTVPVRVTNVRMMLPTVQVRAATAWCGRAPTGSDRPSALWEQITLALRSSVLSRTETTGGMLRFTNRSRTLSVNLEERNVDMITQGIGNGRPFAAADPDSLEQNGYIRDTDDGGREYFAPDETVLLSPSFVRTHCFETPRRDADPALAELRFRPVRGRQTADVEGTAYVDTLSGELRRIDFRYVAAPQMLPSSARPRGRHRGAAAPHVGTVDRPRLVHPHARAHADRRHR